MTFSLLAGLFMRTYICIAPPARFLFSLRSNANDHASLQTPNERLPCDCSSSVAPFFVSFLIEVIIPLPLLAASIELVGIALCLLSSPLRSLESVSSMVQTGLLTGISKFATDKTINFISETTVEREANGQQAKRSGRILLCKRKNLAAGL